MLAGIIPARAGFTGPTMTLRWMRRDHPRSRGVYITDASSMYIHGGSSPLARGLREAAAGPAGRRRIIPARAGFTFHERGYAYHPRDHPRSRGVYPPGSSRSASSVGSSPLARGLRSGARALASCEGIIPARAGFTCLVPSETSGSGDHPRSRGVYLGPADGGGCVPGSSPLARGLRRRTMSSRGVRGIIPARAGFTSPYQ